MSENRSFASVIIDTHIEKPLDYSVPLSMQKQIQLGSCIEVRMRGRIHKGYILELKSKSCIKKLLPIQKLLPKDTWITPELFRLSLWMARYYCSSLSQVFKCMVPSAVKNQIEPKTLLLLSLAKSKSEIVRLLPELRSQFASQAKVLDYLLKKNKTFQSQIIQDLKISPSPIQTLLRKKIISSQKVKAELDSFFMAEEFFPSKPKTLNNEQQKALEKIQDTLGRFAVHLLFGITGSGKTEVYMQSISQALSLKKSVLILVPEVALTSQLIEKFKARFQMPIAVLHHKRSMGERKEDWSSILKDNKKIIIGARSSLFCPAKNLGLIIVDEEHDSSYKQSEKFPSYHARDIAILRAKFEQATVILGSATPSIETYTKALQKKYTLSTLQKRAGSATLPQVHIIDMRKEFEKAGGFTHFSNDLIEGIKKRQKQGEQTLIFLNKRGYYSSQICTKCSQILSCPHCSTSLTYHKKEAILKCHLCDFYSSSMKCPLCKSADTLQYKGFGTEHVQKSLHALLPNIRTLRMDRDTTRKKTSHEELIHQFRSGKADILIGTQMIAKGFHFPSVTLACILNTDAALSIPDFRSSEYVFQLITQVSGRSGREDQKGEVIIQTFLPDHPMIQKAAKADYISFYEEEIESRKMFSFPPYSRMVKLIFSSKDEKKAKNYAENFRNALLKKIKEGHIHKVVSSGYAKIKDAYRFQFLIRTRNILQTTQNINDLKKNFSCPSSVKLFIDVDPTHTF